MSRLLVLTRKPRRLACRTVLAAAVLGFVLPQAASAKDSSLSTASGTGTPEQESTTASRAHELGYSLTPSTTEPYLVCPPPQPGSAACASIAVPPGVARQSSPTNSPSLQSLEPVSPGYEGGGEEKGWAPKELREAYSISETGGSGQTVAIVDAYDDPHANADLKIYREKYKLSACTEENKCFKRINQVGEEKNYPKPVGEEEEEAQAQWDIEISLDVDMVSAVCPECHILLVEANNSLLSNLYAAENEAASWKEAVTEQKATEISNSWYGKEYSEETSDDKYFEHPGIPITAAGGDYGYHKCGIFVSNTSLCYPAASRDVISVGGTELKKADKTAEKPRGWEEHVWEGSGGGCSVYESKPTWQTDWGCPKRMDNDVAGVASPNSPVSLYDEKWRLEGGTSVATPIIAGIEAHASKVVREEGAEAFYRHSLFDVSLGSSGLCGDTYLCTAEEGYDSPTGWGTPDGPLELATGFHAVTGEAASVTQAAATLNGYIDPEGATTTYDFEYGLTTSYGKTAPVPNGEVGSGVVWKAVSRSVSLEQDSVYHYRVVATRGTETIHGQDHTVATIPWAIQSTPTPTETTEEKYNGYLYGVSCSSPTACTGVGWYQNSSNAHVTLADRWNGTEWLVQSTPNPEGGTENRLQGVSCSSPTACMAVGHYTKSGTVMTLVESWNGSSWTVQSTPSPEGAKGSELLGVSCTSPTACTAVGRYYTKEVLFKRNYVMLAERWNGEKGIEKWTIQSTPNPEGATESALMSVSCTTAESCTAVGGDTNSGKKAVGLAERWNGTAWSSHEISTSSGLVGVSCTSTEACTAVTNGLTAERWNGTTWSSQSMPSPIGPKESDLYNGSTTVTTVSCSSANQCVAAGSLHRESEQTTAAWVWNGTEWFVQGAPRPSDGVLYGVSCSSSTACTGVGSFLGYQFPAEGYDHFVTLAEYAALPPTAGDPSATTGLASSLTGTGATLNGTVNPKGSETKYYFEYGTTTAYGTSAPIPSESAGSGTEPVSKSRTITNIQTETTYHFRIVASNIHGTIYGQDSHFRTSMAFEFQFASEGSGAGKLKLPSGVTVDAGGSVWVADYGNNRVEEFASTGEFLLTFGKDVNKTKVESSGTEAERNLCTAPSGNVCQAGKAGSANDQLNLPLGVTFTSGGNLWVTEQGNDRVQEFNTKGEYLAKFGTEGTGTGQFIEPLGIAIASSGNIWVSDARYNRVEEFTASGGYLLTVGATGYGGNGATEFASPHGVAIDSHGNVWVVDAGNDRVQELSAAGGYVSQFGAKGTGEGQFEYPGFIAVRESGDLLVGDHENDRVEEFTPSGEYVTNSCCITWPEGIAVARGGVEYTVDPVNDHVEKWGEPAAPEAVTQEASTVKATEATLKGTVNPIGASTSYYFEYGPTTGYGTKTSEVSAGSGWQNVSESKTIAGLTTGILYHFRIVATNRLGTTDGKDTTFATTPAYSSSFGSEGTGNGQFKHPGDVVFDSKSNLWVLDHANNRVEKFNEKGEYQKAFGSEGSGNGQLKGPDALAVDAKGNIWVVDTGNTRVEEFTEKGEYQKSFGSSGTKEGQFSTPEGIAVDSKGNVWVSDTGSGRLQEFNEKGEYVKTVGSKGSGAGQIGESEGIAIDSKGNVWVADWSNNRVDEFNEKGEYVREFGSVGSGNGQLKSPYGIAVESDGTVWVGDTGNDRVEAFNEKGEYITQFGSAGSGLGQFNFSYPIGLTTDSKGDIWVTDPGNQRVQKWV